MHPLIEQHRKQIVALCEKYGVSRLDVFGSAARADDFDPGRSDVDLLIEIAAQRRDSFSVKDYFDLHEDLERLIERPVDLVFAGSIRNPYLRAEIQRDREIVHAA